MYLWTGTTVPTSPTANVTTNAYSSTTLLAGTVYKWYIAPKNASGANTACASAATSFTTAAVLPVPACVINTTPANNAVLTTQTTASFTWPVASTATSYDIYIWTGTTVPTSPTANVTTNAYSSTTLLAGTVYKWYIAPKNASGANTTCASSATSFTTAASTPVPGCATNATPINATTISTSATASLTWGAVASATSYDVYVYTGATIPTTATANVTTASYTATGLTASTLYNWFVIPKNSVGSAANCGSTNKTTFTTAAPVSSPGIGLQATYYNNETLTDPVVISRVEPTVNYDFVYQQAAPGVNLEHYSVRWAGQVKAVFSETYTFYVTTDDGVRLWVNGVQLVNNWIAQSATEKSGTVTMVAGQKYDIVMEYYQGTGYAVAKLAWSSPSTPKAIIPQIQLYPTGYVDPTPTVPTCAANTSPVNAGTVASASTATLVWGAVSNAVSYDVYIWSGATPPANPTTNTTSATYTATGLTASTLYNWYVIPKNTAGAASGCISNATTFNTGIPAPSCTTNLLPANGAVLTTANTASLTWTAAASATSYDVFIWTGATPPTTATANVTTAAYSATGLLGATTYNWYVVPKNASGSATGCNANSTTFVTAAPPVPACATNTSPANATVIATPTTASLTWSVAANATSYDVYVYTGATIPTTATANVTTASYTATGLTASTLYNWFVIPKNVAGSATGCSTNNKTTFTTAVVSTSPGIGLQATYYNNETLTDPVVISRVEPTVNYDFVYQQAAPGVNLEHYSVRWAGQVKAVFSETYTFYVTTDDGVRLWVNGVQLVNNWIAQSATEKSGTVTMVAGQKYDIVMEYYQGTGYAVAKLAWSSPSTPKAIIPQIQLYPTGYVDPTPTVPTCAANTSPANAGTVASASTATLVWSTISNATSYDVYIWSGATPPANPTTNTTSATYTATGLTASTLYNWYVIPKNAAGAASGCISNATTFTTGIPAPSCTTNLLPANGAVLTTANTASLTWTAAASATSYDVFIWTGATPPTTATANVTTAAYSATGLLGATTYNWYVVPKNASGSATGCNANSTTFVTAAPPVPACATNTSPANATVIATPTTASLTWSVAANATSYDVYVYTGATIPTTATANVTTASYTATGLTASTAYNWFVIPKNVAGSATGCSTNNKTTFTTASASTPGTGLQAVYFNNETLTNPSVITRIEPTVNYDFVYQQAAPGVNLEHYSVRWSGQVKAVFSETYTFYATTDDGVRLWVNGVQLVNNWINQSATELGGTVSMVAGQKYDIVMEYFQGTGYAVAKLAWSSPSTPKAIIPQIQLYPPVVAGALVVDAGLRTADTTAVSAVASVASVTSSLPTITSAVSPNPVAAGQTVKVQITSDKTGAAVINIININGLIISTQKVNLVAGDNNITVNTAALGQGFYIVNITGGTSPINMKLLVQ